MLGRAGAGGDQVTTTARGPDGSKAKGEGKRATAQVAWPGL
jgi:hypothetical protein